jgi:MerR family transcriptional regulator, heat shock protein HspR
MAEQKYIMVRVKSDAEYSSELSLREVACRCGIHPELVERFVQLGLIDHLDQRMDGEILFSDDVIPLVRRILRLRNQLGVNYAGIGVILELMARIETLEASLREMQNKFFDDM